LGGEDEVAFVLPVGVVDNDDRLADSDVGNRLVDRREDAHDVGSVPLRARRRSSARSTRRSTYFASTSTSTLTWSPGCLLPHVVRRRVSGMTLTRTPSPSTAATVRL